jgi:hypothetical protein
LRPTVDQRLCDVERDEREILWTWCGRPRPDARHGVD